MIWFLNILKYICSNSIELVKFCVGLFQKCSFCSVSQCICINIYVVSLTMKWRLIFQDKSKTWISYSVMSLTNILVKCYLSQMYVALIAISWCLWCDFWPTELNTMLGWAGNKEDFINLKLLNNNLLFYRNLWLCPSQ